MTGKTTEKTRARKVAIEVLQQINIFSPWKSVKNPDLQMLENSSLKAGSLEKSFLERAMDTKWIHGAVNIFLGKNTVSEWIQHYHNEGLNRRNNAQQQGKTFLGTKGGADGPEANDDDDEMELTVFETTRLIALEVTRSLWFNLMVICVILINSVLIAFDFEKSSWESGSWYLEMIFMSIYTTEAILKVIKILRLNIGIIIDPSFCVRSMETHLNTFQAITMSLTLSFSSYPLSNSSSAATTTILP